MILCLRNARNNIAGMVWKGTRMPTSATYISRERISELLLEFGINCKDRMLTYALVALGIAPEGPLLPGQKRLYDEITVWLIASAHRGINGAFQALGPNATPKLPEELEAFRCVWKQVSATDEAALLPCRLREDPEFAAQMLMLTSPDRGMGASEVIRWSHKKPELLDLCSEGREFLVQALTAYKNVSGDWLKNEPLEVDDSRLISREMLRHWFASSWVREMARLTEIAARTEGDDA